MGEYSSLGFLLPEKQVMTLTRMCKGMTCVCVWRQSSHLRSLVCGAMCTSRLRCRSLSLHLVLQVWFPPHQGQQHHPGAG